MEGRNGDGLACKDEQCYQEIPAFWQACGEDGRGAALPQAAGKKSNELLDAGVTYGHNPNGELNYMIGCRNHTGATPQGDTLLSIPKQTWAVFSVIWEEGKDEDLHNTWQKIYAEWFPSTQYQHADCDFDMELYYGDRDASYGVEIWIPIAHQ